MIKIKIKKMFTLINYLKNYENKISESEQIETQFLARDSYTTENFNLNSFSKIIMNKINDSKNLITLLNNNINDLKNEILHQINSNFNNHIILISKIQTVDFLIDNIEKPLYSIKNKIQNKLEYIIKNENELKMIIEYLIKNEKELHNAKLSFNYFKLISQSKSIETSLVKKEESSVIKNILDNNENTSILNGYNFIKEFLIETFRLLTINQKIRNLSEALTINLNQDYINKINENENNSINKIVYVKDNFSDIFSSNQIISFINKIHADDEKRFFLLDRILEVCLSEFLESLTQKNQEEMMLHKTLLELLYTCYKTQNKLIEFYEKIKVTFFINEINDLFNKEANINKNNINSNSNITLALKLKKLEDILDKKYSFLFEICIHRKYLFNLICIWVPLFNKLVVDKNVFICLDPETFSSNVNSILELIQKYSINNDDNFLEIENDENNYNLKINNSEEKNLNFIQKSFQKEIEYYELIKKNLLVNMQNFSFFTYFQFLQNDITKIIINSTITDKSIIERNFNLNEISLRENLENGMKSIEEIKSFLFNMSNFLFNLNKYLFSLFKEKKLYLKNIPNFLNFIVGCLKLILKNLLYIVKEDKSYLKSFIKLEEESQNVKFENDQQIKIKIKETKQSLIDLFNNLIKYLNTVSQMKNNLFDIVDRESFIFTEKNDDLLLKEKISKICIEFDFEKFNKEMLNTETIKYFFEEKNEFPANFIENLKSLQSQ